MHVDSNIVFGILLWDQAAREGPDDYEGTPHVWLDVAGADIDNANVDIPENGAEYFYRAKSGNSFRRENPLTSNLKVYLGQDAPQTDPESHARILHNLRIFREFTRGRHAEKFLVFALKFCELNPTVAMYDILMKEFLSNQFALDPSASSGMNLLRTWSETCWGCLQAGTESTLKTCADCKTARYCDTACQKSDWKLHKLLHKELEHTRHVLNVE